MGKFEDKVLLKLRRKYSKDEAVSLAMEKLSKEKVSHGMTKSELYEAQDKIKYLEQELGRVKSLVPNEDLSIKVKDQEKTITDLKSHVKGLQSKLSLHPEKIGDLRRKVRKYRDQYISLKVKFDKLIEKTSIYEIKED